MTAVMILCAGLGTRLRPLTEELPKPLVPVGDRPAVVHVLDAVRRALPAASIVLNAHHRAASMRQWAEANGVRVSEETELLGTAGGLAAAARLLPGGDVLVWNGDILAELDVALLLARHAHGGAIASLAVAPRAKGQGNVGLDAEGRVVRLRKESFAEEERGGDFLGIHVVSGELRTRLPRTGCLVGDVYLPALRDGARIVALETETPFVDVGSMAAYAEANRAWLARAGTSAWVHPAAHVAPGADVTGSVVGEGARVLADAVRSIVWPGAVVASSVADAVVTRERVVPLA